MLRRLFLHIRLRFASLFLRRTPKSIAFHYYCRNILNGKQQDTISAYEDMLIDIQESYYLDRFGAAELCCFLNTYVVK